MSMHGTPLTPLEEEGLKVHGLKIGTASQNSDCFRLGIAWALRHELQDPTKRVEIQSCRLGSYGKAYDGPLVCRAYTSSDQPGNGPAWKLGKAVNAANQMAYGDEIDRGLNLLRALFNEGFGVFELPKKEKDDAHLS